MEPSDDEDEESWRGFSDSPKGGAGPPSAPGEEETKPVIAGTRDNLFLVE